MDERALEEYVSGSDGTIAKTGYGDNSSHEFLRDRHENVSGKKTTDDTKYLSRDSLRLQYGADALNALTQRARDLAFASIKATEAEDAERAAKQAEAAGAIQEAAASAMGDPETALIVADTEAVLPNEESPVKFAAAASDIMMSKVASRVAERPIISFGTSNKVVDFLGALVPLRDYVGQFQAAKGLAGNFKDSVNLSGYYGTLRNWQTLDAEGRLAAFNEIEEAVWNASGNNEFIYLTMIDPFLDPSDEIWAKVGIGASAVDLASILIAAPRLFKVYSNFIKGQKYYSKALKYKNGKLAGKAALRDMEKGYLDPIVEAWPVAVPEVEGFKAAPWAVPDLPKPVYMTMIDEMVERGFISGPDDLIVKLDNLTDVEREKILDFYTSGVAKGGRILDASVDGSKIEITLERKVASEVAYENLISQQRTARETIKRLQNELRKEIYDSPVGVNVTAKAALTTELEKARGMLHRTTTAISDFGKPVAGTKVPMEETIVHNITVDDIGRLEAFDSQKRIGLFSYGIGSQEAKGGSIFPRMVTEGTFTRQQQLRLFGMFDQSIKEVFSSLKGKVRSMSFVSERDRVSALLLTGDRKQRLYTTRELVSGVDVDGIGRVAFNEREIQAYNRVREIFDNMWLVVNKTQIDELTFAGYKEFRVKMPKKGGAFEWLAVHAKAEDAGRGADAIRFSIPRIGKGRAKTAIDAETGEIVDLDTISGLDKALNLSQKGFVTLKEEVVIGKQRFRHLLVDVEEAGQVRKTKQARQPGYYKDPLDYRRGYVPKMTNEPIQYVVSRLGKNTVNGVAETSPKLLRGFTTRGEAEEFLRQIGPGAGAKVDAVTELRKTPGMKPLADLVDKQLFSGSFTGYRHGDSSFKVGLDGHEAKRVSAWEAMRRYADFVGNYVPSHTYKQAVIARFMRDLKDPKTGQSALAVPSDWTSEIIKSRVPNTDMNYRVLQAQQKWMFQTFAVPTSQENLWDRAWNALRMSLDNMAWKKSFGSIPWARKTLIWAHNKILVSKFARDPVQQLKGLVFDTMLGMFNPAQFFVQSAGMMIPMSLHPLEAMKAFPKFAFLRYAFHMRSLNDVEKAAKAVGLNGKEMREMVRALNRSGIPESVLETGDFGHFFGQHAGWHSAGMWNDIRDKGRMFYKMGELNNRIFAFTMAFERLAAKKGWDITKGIDNAKLQDIVQEGLRLGINFTAANKARWQDGIAGLPTQFLQVTHKYIENMLYGLFRRPGSKENQWTRAESMSAVFYNTIMFGAAGWGVDELWSGFNRWLTDPEGMGLDPSIEGHREWIAFFRGGFMETLTLKVFGAELDVSGRVSPIGGVAQLWENQIEPILQMAIEGELSDNAGQVILGAASSFGTRVHKAASEIWYTLGAAAEQEKWDHVTLLSVVNEFGKLTSGYSNFLKAHIMLNVQDIPKGTTWEGMGFYDESIPNSVVLAQALGFPQLDVNTFYNIRSSQKARTKDINDIAKTIYTYRKQILTVSEDGVVTGTSPIAIQNANRIQHLLLNRLDPNIRAEVYKKMMEMSKQDADGDLFMELWKFQLQNTPESEAEKDARADQIFLRSLFEENDDNAN